MKWYEKLEQRRQAYGYSRADVVRYVSQYLPEDAGFCIKTLYSWEVGRTKPNVWQAMALAHIYEMSVADLFSEDALLDAVPLQGQSNLESGLNDAGRSKLWEYRSLLLESPRYRTQPELRVCRTLPVYLQAASAGTGQMLDDGACDMVEVDDSVPVAAEFGVRLAGDSMEPRFVDGQIVWAAKQETAQSGDIVLCYLDGQSYCKQLREGEDGVTLVSLNPQYTPITVRPESGFHIFGKVLR